MNTLTLAIVSDGNGYPERLAIARFPESRRRFVRWAQLVSHEAFRSERRFGDKHSFAMLAETMTELEAYYAEHVAEIDRCAAENAAAAAARSGGV